MTKLEELKAKAAKAGAKHFALRNASPRAREKAWDALVKAGAALWKYKKLNADATEAKQSKS